MGIVGRSRAINVANIGTTTGIGTVTDPFTRTTANGWGTGPMGLWSIQPHVGGPPDSAFSCDGSNAIIDNTAGSLGEISVPLPASVARWPIEIVGTFTWTGTWTSFQIGISSTFSAFSGEITGFDSRTSVGSAKFFAGPAPGTGGAFTLGSSSFFPSNSAKTWVFRFFASQDFCATYGYTTVDGQPRDWQSGEYKPTPGTWTPKYLWVILYPGQKVLIQSLTVRSAPGPLLRNVTIVRARPVPGVSMNSGTSLPAGLFTNVVIDPSGAASGGTLTATPGLTNIRANIVLEPDYANLPTSGGVYATLKLGNVVVCGNTLGATNINSASSVFIYRQINLEWTGVVSNTAPVSVSVVNSTNQTIGFGTTYPHHSWISLENLGAKP